MRVLYLAGPFRAPTPWLIEQNIRRAEEIALEVWKREHACISPHLNTRHFQDSAPDRLWLDGDLEIINRCDAVLLVPNWEGSEGTRAEVKFCHKHNIPVFDDFEECIQYLDKLEEEVKESKNEYKQELR